MDWSKAKRILIIAFLIVNIVLLSSNIYRTKGMKEYTTTEEEVKNQFEKINVKFVTEIPKEIPNIGFLEVKYEDYSTDTERIKIAGKFLQLSDVIDLSNIELEDDIITFNSDNEKIDIIDDKKLVYINKKRENIENLNYDPSEIVKVFLEDKGFRTDDYLLKNMKKSGDSYNIEYTKKYKDTVVEKSYMKFNIHSSKVVGFERLWIDTIEEKGKTFRLKPATDSLLKLLSEEDIIGKEIENIDACYYFDPTDTDIFDFEEPRAGDAVPAWNVEFTDGTNKYIYNN